ncbi:hypothetical protein [Polaromonas glacialis]|uniref:hypothetical protein n=1 Tax=Polaromonas glacialis TaxID=866564 RepID=UPI0012EBB41A
MSDNGNGISPGLLPHIFELFTQAERTPDRVQGGLGWAWSNTSLPCTGARLKLKAKDWARAAC